MGVRGQGRKGGTSDRAPWLAGFPGERGGGGGKGESLQTKVAASTPTPTPLTQARPVFSSVLSAGEMAPPGSLPGAPRSQGNHLKRKLVLKWPGESVKPGRREWAKAKGLLQLLPRTSAGRPWP